MSRSGSPSRERPVQRIRYLMAWVLKMCLYCDIQPEVKKDSVGNHTSVNYLAWTAMGLLTEMCVYSFTCTRLANIPLLIFYRALPCKTVDLSPWQPSVQSWKLPGKVKPVAVCHISDNHCPIIVSLPGRMNNSF